MQPEVLLERGADMGEDPTHVVGQALILQRSHVDVLEGQVARYQVRPDRGMPFGDHPGRRRLLEGPTGGPGATTELRVQSGGDLQQHGGGSLGRRPIGPDEGP